MLALRAVSSASSTSDPIFLRACRRQPVSRTPIWLMRQAGRYMAEYRAVRKQHSLIEICKTPALAAEVTITAAEKLGVDAAIIFADLLLPLEVMGMPFRFEAGEGPVIESPLRDGRAIAALRTDRASELGYVSESIARVGRHFGEKLPVIGFCGAPFTLASYMIEGSGSRHYINTKKLMYSDRGAWHELMEKLVTVLAAYATDQVRAGATAFQVFDSWVGCLSAEDYREFALPATTRLIKAIRKTGVPVIYFGTDTATLLPDMRETGADVLGVDWRISLTDGWKRIGHDRAIQGNLDPVALFANEKEVLARAAAIVTMGQARPGHIFNLGHGILPETPVENVQSLVRFVHEFSAQHITAGAR